MALMAEDAIKEKSEVRVPLRGAEAAKATLERLQSKGILPVREPKTPSPPPAEEYNPAEKAFNIRPENIPQAVRRIPGGVETIPPEIKKELTEEAKNMEVKAEKDAAWVQKVITENRARQAAKVATETKPVNIASQEVAPAAAPWIKREQARMVQGTQTAAVRQAAAEPQPKPPLPTREEVAAKQSIAKGQEIKKRWYDRFPFLRVLRGERQPAG